MERERIKEVIAHAFASVERPGNWALRGSNEGEEPYLLEKEFADKQDWRTVDAAFLDQAPDGYSSALSFFSDEAFRYFLPAYLRFKAEHDELQRELIGQAIENYWGERAA